MRDFYVIWLAEVPPATPWGGKAYSYGQSRQRKNSLLKQKWFADHTTKKQGGLYACDKDINSLDHTTYRCQNHIVFVPKFRRQVIYREWKG